MSEYKERLVISGIDTLVEHTVFLPQCCPRSGNPQPGSTLSISYRPTSRALAVEQLGDMVNEYRGGHPEIREMEGMIQHIAQRVANELCLPVKASAELVINPANGGAIQQMRVIVNARSNMAENEP